MILKNKISGYFLKIPPNFPSKKFWVQQLHPGGVVKLEQSMPDSWELFSKIAF